MKKILFFTLVLCSLSAHLQAQEQSCDYIPYQDSLFLLRCVNVTESGFDGIADTTVTYSTPPLDSFQLKDQIAVQGLNRSNQIVARVRNNRDFRFLFSEIAASDALLESLNSDYYEETTARFGNNITGRYRILTDTSRFVQVAAHPARADLLRATDETSSDVWNIRLVSRDMIQLINYDGTTYYLIWDGVSTEKKVFREVHYFFPAVLIPNESVDITIVKLD